MHANRDLITGFLKNKLQFKVANFKKPLIIRVLVHRRMIQVDDELAYCVGFCDLRLAGDK